jgi:uncharacterized glyoxalase superfamily metalloenzyme YdcJ
MNSIDIVSSDDIRSRFSQKMSDMYRLEVPQYGQLLDLVAKVNQAHLDAEPALRDALVANDELHRLGVERHGAIRVGTAAELSTLRRVFQVMGLFPVGYYDLSVAGVPVHSTAFRPVDDQALTRNPFRIFTSLLRLELIEDEALRTQAAEILAKRQIFTARALELTEIAESNNGLTNAQADEFVQEVLETFRWHGESTVTEGVYHELHDAHRLIADVVCFRNPHINHLTPRTLDIDAAQVEMGKCGISAKDVIEGPPRRKHPILLRQTSFKALEESIKFATQEAGSKGTHTARFGEIEQRGMALTPKGRELYDTLLSKVRDEKGAGNAGADYGDRLASVFTQFPDTIESIHEQGLAYFRYRVLDADLAKSTVAQSGFDLHQLVVAKAVEAEAIIYEDFLPVSAAGIFQSNLGGTEQRSYSANAARAEFEKSLGAAVQDEFALYEQSQEQSIQKLKSQLA